MEVIIKPYYALPCACEVFTINKKAADIDDFGYMDDTSPETAPEYGCGCKQFIADRHKADEAMIKYNITLEDFNTVCDMLEEKLYVGGCGWCI